MLKLVVLLIPLVDQQSQTQLYGSFLGSPSTHSHLSRRPRDEEDGISEDGDLTDEEEEWYDEGEEQDGEYDDDVDEYPQVQEAYSPDPRRFLTRPPPASLSQDASSPQSILREPGSVASSPADERRVLLATKMPSYSGSNSDTIGSGGRRPTIGSTASPRVRRLSNIARRKSISKPPRGSSSFGQTVSCRQGSFIPHKYGHVYCMP